MKKKKSLAADEPVAAQFKKPAQPVTQASLPLNEHALTKAQLAKEWNVSERTINDWMREGKIRYRKISTCVVRFIPSEVREDLDKFLVGKRAA